MLVLLAAVTAVGLTAVLIDFERGRQRLRSLTDITPAPPYPALSIVVAARNEARQIEAAVTSLVHLDYPAFEIIVADDRSADATGVILDRLARQHACLKVTHISALPEGWLGKNHALAVGAAKASRPLVLFTDADVVFEPTTLKRAVTLMTEEGLDHLTAIPNVTVPGLALNAFIAAFAVFFSIYARPWKARDPRSRWHMGVGAFNLLRTEVYRAIGTHRAIAMRPDDDMKLGKLVKKMGFRQDVVYGREDITVEWYSSLRELVDGLMKNAFAGVDYSLLAVAGSTTALILMYVWPVLGVFATHGATRVLNDVNVGLLALIFWTSARAGHTPFGYVLAFPFAVVLFAYIMWRSALLAIVRGHVTWRGTAYPLSQMRANRV